jgi:hypothetical protein
MDTPSNPNLGVVNHVSWPLKVITRPCDVSAILQVGLSLIIMFRARSGTGTDGSILSLVIFQSPTSGLSGFTVLAGAVGTSGMQLDSISTADIMTRPAICMSLTGYLLGSYN